MKGILLIGAKKVFKIMKKNIYKKFIILGILSFVLLGFNSVFAEDDITPPVITLNGASSISIFVNENYTDPGATAIDNIDGNITSSILKSGNVDSSIIGIYTITYDVSDTASNNAQTIKRIVEVKPKPKAEFIIRNGDSIIYNGFIELPSIGTIKIPDKDEVEHNIDSRSVLALLYTIDQNRDEFLIPDLEYNSGFGSLYLKCLIPKDTESLCNDWQYVVNNKYPSVGMDKNSLSGDEKIYIYFGPQNKILLNKNSINTEENLTVTSQKYDYENNLWLVRTGVTIGVTKPDPNNSWSPNDDIKSKVDDTSGVVTFLSITEGEYDVGVKEDYYWPTEKLIVIKKVLENNGSGGGGSTPISIEKIFSIQNALNFISSKQKNDGSFGSDIYTDWAAIAASAGNSYTLKSSILNYLKSNPIDSSILTDNERRAMALMALGVNPYNGTDINYIKKIVDSFDGIQFGDMSLINDDVFALIVLSNAGYNSNDEIIKKDINYLISKQSSSGGWGSVDMTAAGIEALRSFSGLDGLTNSISIAENYLISNQNINGGFDNSFSTSWVLQSITKEINILKAKNYLANNQQVDGGLENVSTDIDTRVWATSYAIPAILHMSWNDILNDFSKPEEVSTALSDIKKEEIKNIVVEPVIIIEEKKKEVKIAENKEENKSTIKTVQIIKRNKVKIKQNDSSLTTQISDYTLNQMASAGSLVTPVPNIIISTLNHIWVYIKLPFIWFWSFL